MMTTGDAGRGAVVLLCALIGSGCKGKADVARSPSGVSSASSDALWALAPPRLSVAMVARDGSLARLHAGLLRFLESLEKAPGGGEIAALVRAKLVVEGVNLLDPAAFTDLGLDLRLGAAVFMVGDDAIAVPPVVDAKKFFTRFKGVRENGVDRLLDDLFCKTISGRYVCADKPGFLAAVGKAPGPAMGNMMRGDVEMFVGADLVDPSTEEEFRIDDPKGLRGSLLLERGGFTARAHMIGTPAGRIALLRSSPSPLLKGLAEESPSGIFSLQAGAFWRQERAKAVAASGGQVLPGGVTLGAVIGSVTGDIAFYTLPGSSIRGEAKLGLSNPEPFRKLLAACAQLGAGLPPGISLTEKGNRCVLSFNPHSFMPTVAATSFSAEMWVASDAVVVEFGEAAAASTAAPELPPFGQDLLAGSWCLAFWGHGALNPGSMPFASEVWPQLRASDPTGGLVLWGLLHLNELGFAMEVADDGVHMLARVRTLWSNPDEVLTEVERRIGEFARGNADALKDMEGLAAKNPRSPFARDVAAGPSFLVPVAGLAAVAIPAFMEYIKKSKSAEARAKVTSIVTAVRSYQAEHGKLPRPSSAMTPPAGACCANGDTCAPDAALWRVEPWRSLGFAIGEPHYYSYQYEVAPDGKTFHVRAIGDLDCDGVQSTFELESDPRTPADREITVQNELE